MKVKYLGRQKSKIYRSTERFGETYYKLIFEKLSENELENRERERERERETKIGIYSFIDNISPEKWKLIESKKLVNGDILEISINSQRMNRFGREEEYFHLLDFKIDRLVKVEQLKQEIFDLIGEIGDCKEELEQLQKIKQDIEKEINKKSL